MNTDAAEVDTKAQQQSSAGGQPSDDDRESFAETALKLGGKSAEEARRTGAIDKADDQVESLFKFKTTASPVHRAVWDKEVPVELFQSYPAKTDESVTRVMNESLEVVRRRREEGALYKEDRRKLRDDLLTELAGVGYWGLLVSKEYGGVGASFQSFSTFLTRMATLEGTVAGLASVHGCIGAVDPLRTFGTDEQKREYLPKLASGERLSAFALTEPGAGSDLTALSTRAELDGEDYVVNGEKLFITNVVPGRTIGLVCLVSGRPAVLIADLPEQENEHFQLKEYGLYAITGAYNRGIIFKDFRVPAKNLLQPARGDGLTIAYHGLNLGRVALCANASGTMRGMLASMLPWARFRHTYGQAIASRELVRRRLGQTAALIVGCDALVQWCSRLLDEGYRGEMECIIAKIFGSEAQKQAAIEYLMKTHGGRSFLHGHIFGDNVHEFLAPCIYEGEGEMLGMAFFKSLIKEHGTTYFEPIGKALMAAGIKKPNPTNPAHAWALKGPASKWLRWAAGQKLKSPRYTLPPMPDRLRAHAEFACDFLQRSPQEISIGAMFKHQLALADRQCRMAEISQRIQDATTMLCTTLYAARSDSDELTRDAADILCQDLTRKLTGRRPSDEYYRSVCRLGEAIADGGFQALAGVPAEEILMPYKQN